MKTDLPPDNEQRLTLLLRDWNVDTTMPPAFQERVWSRIERLQNEPGPGRRLWRDLLEVARGSMHNARLAYSYAVVLLALGIAIGTWTAHVKSNRIDSELGKRYLRVLTPYEWNASQ